MVVDAISLLDPQLLDVSLVGVKKVPGGSVTDSFLVQASQAWDWAGDWWRGWTDWVDQSLPSLARSLLTLTDPLNNIPQQGVAFKKTFSYAGFEQMPKFFANPKILLLNVELELKSEKDNAEVRIDDPDGYQVREEERNSRKD